MFGLILKIFFLFACEDTVIDIIKDVCTYMIGNFLKSSIEINKTVLKVEVNFHMGYIHSFNFYRTKLRRITYL